MFSVHFCLNFVKPYMEAVVSYKFNIGVIIIIINSSINVIVVVILIITISINMMIGRRGRRGDKGAAKPSK